MCSKSKLEGYVENAVLSCSVEGNMPASESQTRTCFAGYFARRSSDRTCDDLKQIQCNKTTEGVSHLADNAVPSVAFRGLFLFLLHRKQLRCRRQQTRHPALRTPLLLNTPLHQVQTTGTSMQMATSSTGLMSGSSGFGLDLGRLPPCHDPMFFSCYVTTTPTKIIHPQTDYS